MRGYTLERPPRIICTAAYTLFKERFIDEYAYARIANGETTIDHELKKVAKEWEEES